MNYHIEIGKRLGEIHFGMDRNDVLDYLGKADKIYMTDFNCERWQYFEHLIELSFEPEDNYLLGWIEVYNNNVTLFDKKLLGMTQEEVVSFLNNYFNEEPDIEDYGSFISLSYDNSWVELQFQFDKLRNINFGKVD